ncbi:MAG: hypothetical protein BWY09_02417 [Candidatus Hydrogenedentes bacterium ADurb.Bin179]|nr:MAG: hypothetical protein BWY09_02417 [Candidatus Hydrogenedentes bacterium ADurb.Bin179]
MEKCPRCGSENVARYLFGLPNWNPELMDKVTRKEVKLGGCCMSMNDPRYHCNACQLDFGFPHGKDGGEKQDH